MTEQIALKAHALRGVEISPHVNEMLRVVYAQHPDKADLLPLVQALQGAWHSDPARILAFFLRDNPNVVPMMRSLMGLDVLDWEEPMWKSAVESDSFAQFMVMALATKGKVDPPRQPPAGLIEAIQDEHYEVAAAYMAFYGHVAAPGIADRWTQFYWALYETGEPEAVTTAQMINGMMKRHAAKAWQRDVGRIAKKFSESKNMSLDTCQGYLDSEADTFADAAETALKFYVFPQWTDYPVNDIDVPDEDEGEDEGDDTPTDPYSSAVDGYFVLMELEGSDAPEEVRQNLLTLTQNMAALFNNERVAIAERIVATGKTDKSLKEVIADLRRLEIGV